MSSRHSLSSALAIKVVFKLEEFEGEDYHGLCQRIFHKSLSGVMCSIQPLTPLSLAKASSAVFVRRLLLQYQPAEALHVKSRGGKTAWAYVIDSLRPGADSSDLLGLP